MKNRIIIFSKKPFVRNVIIMVTGTAAAQAVAMALSPIITRLYGPEAFGLMGLFMAIVGIVAPIAALTYPIAIVLPKSDSNAKGLIKLSLYISTGISASVGLLLMFFQKPIVRIFNIEEIAGYLYLIPLIIFFAGFLQVMEQWLIRTKQFGITAKVAFLQSLILNGSKVGIGIFYPIASVLIILSALGTGINAIMLALFGRNTDYKQAAETHQEQIPIKKLAKNYRDFPLYRAPELFINSISQSLPIFLLSIFFGPASAGFYSICRTVLNLPTLLIGKSVGDVFYPRISEANKNGENLTKLIKKATLALGTVGIIPYGIIILFGPWLFGIVFGPDWVTAGEYARWVGLSSFFVFLNKPSVTSLPVLSAQKMQLNFTFISLLFRIVVLLLSIYIFNDDLLAVASYCVANSLLNIILIFITLRKSSKFDSQK